MKIRIKPAVQLVSPSGKPVKTRLAKTIVRVNKYGNALFVSIPRAVTVALGVKQYDYMRFTVKRGTVSYRRVRLENDLKHQQRVAPSK